MEEGVQFAAKYGAKVYVAAKHGYATKEMKKGLVSGSVNCVIIGIAAVIVSDQP